MNAALMTSIRLQTLGISIAVCILVNVAWQLTLPLAIAADTAVAAETATAASEAPTSGVAVLEPTGSAASSDRTTTGTLSVAPSAEVQYAEGRPDWLDAGPSLSGRVHRWPVVSSPSSTAELSRRALQVQLRAAAETYVETLLDSPGAPAVIALEDDWIRERLASDRHYEGEVFVADEVFYEAAAELHFDPKSRAWIESQWVSHRVGRRMIGLGAMTLGGVALLLMASSGLSIIARRAERRVHAPDV